jgi:hypothetical protein
LRCPGCVQGEFFWYQPVILAILPKVTHAMIVARLIAVAAVAGLAGCATPQTRLERGLIAAGLPKRQSACMAQRMDDKLSLFQLRRIGSLANFKDEKLGEMSADRFMHNIRSLKDPEILSVTTRAAIGCAISR